MKETVQVVRCRYCKHRPIGTGVNHDVQAPTDGDDYYDYTCPCLNQDDNWYSWMPSDEWFCANGEIE